MFSNIFHISIKLGLAAEVLAVAAPGRHQAVAPAAGRCPRRRVDGLQRWHSVEPPTSASVGACSTWTKRSTSCAARCQRLPTKSGCRASRRSVSPSPTFPSWQSCWRGRRPARTPSRPPLDRHPPFLDTPVPFIVPNTSPIAYPHLDLVKGSKFLL